MPSFSEVSAGPRRAPRRRRGGGRVGMPGGKGPLRLAFANVSVRELRPAGALGARGPSSARGQVGSRGQANSIFGPPLLADGLTSQPAKEEGRVEHGCPSPFHRWGALRQAKLEQGQAWNPRLSAAPAASPRHLLSPSSYLFPSSFSILAWAPRLCSVPLSPFPPPSPRPAPPSARTPGLSPAV